MKTGFFAYGDNIVGGKMLDGDVFDFSRTGPMTLESANGLVGVLNRVTQKHSKQVNDLIARLEALGATEKEKTSEIESVINRMIEDWNAKVRKLGGVPKGLWLVDIDSGDGYYCWKYPENEIGYWHDYKSGFTGRISLSERDKLSSRQNEEMDAH